MSTRRRTHDIGGAGVNTYHIAPGGGSDSHTYYLPGNAEEVTPTSSLIKYYRAGRLATGENSTTDAAGIL
jgi:hypothetical protein